MTCLLWLACMSEPPPRTPVPEPPTAAPVPVVPAPAAPVPEPLPSAGPFVRELLPGLTVAAYEPPAIPDGDLSRPPAADVTGIDPRIFVVTLDPARFEVRYLSSLDVGGAPKTADRWADEHGLVVAWNPGMFEPDGRGTGHTRAGDFVSQPEFRRNALYSGYFTAGPGARVVFGKAPKGAGTYATRAEMPADLLTALDGYALVAQSLVILKDGQPAYPPRTNHWSELAFGTDDQGRVAVVYTRYPYEMRELGRRLQALGIGLDDLIHGEGGPEASLVIRAGGVGLDLFGSYETGFYDDRNDRLWALPAVMGARPHSSSDLR